MRKFFAIAPLLIILSLALGCQKAGQNSGEKAAKPAEKAAGGSYLAKVNNVPITEEDVKSELKSLPPQVRAAFLAEGGIESFLDELVKKELLYQEAKKKGMDKSEDLTKKMEEFRKLMMIELLLEEAVEKKAEVVSEKEAKDFYEKNKKEFIIEKKGKKETIEFEKAKEFIVQKLSSEKQRDVFDTYIGGLKNAGSVEMNKAAIAELSNKASQPGENKTTDKPE